MTDNKILDLDKVRKRIDEIDSNIQALIAERAKIVLDVGNIKRQSDKDTIFYRPEREAIILKKVMSRECGPLPEEEMGKIFRSIMASCLALQQPLNVAFLGPEGTFSQAAVAKHFGESVNLHAQSSINDVFAAVDAKKVSYGVVPIENSIGGVVNATMDAFIDSKLQICGEVSLPIHQHLLVHKDADAEITQIYSHEQSLLQCSKWLSQHYPNVEQIAVSSNAYAAQLAAENQSAAAIAGDLARDKFNLKAVAENIEDEPNNTTRFLVLCHQSPPATGDDRTTLLISISNAPGTLEKLIKPFSENNLNLTLIKSRPSLKQKDAYIFFLDVDVHKESDSFQKTVKSLNEQAGLIKVLGSYPKAVL